jgi:hypothetical protein
MTARPVAVARATPSTVRGGRCGVDVEHGAFKGAAFPFCEDEARGETGGGRGHGAKGRVAFGDGVGGIGGKAAVADDADVGGEGGGGGGCGEDFDAVVRGFGEFVRVAAGYGGGGGGYGY